MRLTIGSLVVALALGIAGCASNKDAKYSEVPGTPTADHPIVKSADVLNGKVVSYNSIGRFAVLNFPVTQMPAVGQTMFIFRDGLKVGEVKITGPQKDDNIVADLAQGQVKPGDEVRDR